MTSCTLLTPDSPAWDTTLASFTHDFYHLPGYLRMSAEDAGGKAVACHIVSDGCELFLPLVIRPLPEWCGSGQDGQSPYGYPGPLVRWAAEATEEQKSSTLNTCLKTMTTALRELGLVSAFIRLHPLLPLPGAPLASHGLLFRHGVTVSMDLSLDEEALWKGVRKDHRYQVRQAQKQGLVVEHDVEWHALDDFLTAYHQTMARVDAAAHYYFDRRYIERMRSALDGRIHLLVVRESARVIAAALFVETNGIVQYHLSGTHDDCVELRPTKPMLWEAARWAKARGNKVFHLGGGVGAQEDSLFLFKAGFSARRHEFSTWRIIVDPDAYQRLSGLALDRRGSQAPNDFFPAYRAG